MFSLPMALRIFSIFPFLITLGSINSVEKMKIYISKQQNRAELCIKKEMRC